MAAKPKSEARRSQWPLAGSGHAPADLRAVVRIQSRRSWLAHRGQDTVTPQLACPPWSGYSARAVQLGGLCVRSVWTLRLFLPQGPGSWASFMLSLCRICTSSRIGLAGVSCCCAFRTPGAGGAGRGPGGRGECTRALWASLCLRWAVGWGRAAVAQSRLDGACPVPSAWTRVRTAPAWPPARPPWHLLVGRLLCAGPRMALGGWHPAGPRDPSDAEGRGLS